MRAALLFASIATLLNASAARTQTANDVQFAIDAIYSLCVGGGGAVSVSGGGKADASLSLKSTGRIQGEVTISRSDAKGLVQGLNNALSSLAAEQADKVRDCIEPYRDRIMNLVLSPPPSARPSPSPAPSRPEGSRDKAISAAIQLTQLLSKESSSSDEIMSKLQVPFCSLTAIYTTDDLRPRFENRGPDVGRMVVSLANINTLGGINFGNAITIVELGSDTVANIRKCASYGIFMPLDYLITVNFQIREIGRNGILDYIVDGKTGLVKGMFVRQ